MAERKKLTPARVLRAVALAGGVVIAAYAGGGWVATPLVDGVDYGAPTPLGNGTARVYIEMQNGAPVELGIALSEKALEGLPTHHTPGGIELEPGHMMFFWTPELPGTNPTAVRHVYLGWNPGGHEPPGVYDVPHFDFHFYTIGNDERLAIDPADPAFAGKAAHHPAAGLMPEGYVAIPGAVPFMGAHWVDPTSPELNGTPFTETFIFGSWDGRPIFVEPMITRAFLETRPDHFERLPIPATQETAGYQPGAYRVRWDEATREYRVALTDFVWRNGTDG